MVQLTLYQIFSIIFSVFSILLALRMLYFLLFRFGRKYSSERTSTSTDEDDNNYTETSTPNISAMGNQQQRKLEDRVLQLRQPQSNSAEPRVQLHETVVVVVVVETTSKSNLVSEISLGIRCMNFWRERIHQASKKYVYPFKKYGAISGWSNQKKLRVASLLAFILANTAHLVDSVLRYIYVSSGEPGSFNTSQSNLDNVLNLLLVGTYYC